MTSIRDPEKENLEFKSCTKGRLPEDFWEVVTAFSNLEGGTVYLGADQNGQPLGLNNGEVDQLQRSVQSDSKNAYNHELYPQISVDNCVVAVFYPEVPASLKHIYNKKRGPIVGARVRVGSSNEHISSEWLRRFALAAQGGAELAVYRPIGGESFDDALLDSYLDEIRKERGKDVFANLNRGEVLRKLRATDENGQLTLFGLLAFGGDSSPQDIIGPNTKVAVTRYAGLDKVDPLDAGETSLEDIEFGGNIKSQFYGAYEYILSRLPRKNRIEETGRRVSYPAIPQVAVREALANALAHRDYSVSASKIQVDMYSDRIEFTSPGRSLVPLKDLENAHSETRNPVLMNYLREIGITEQRARGIRTIKVSLRRAGLLDPVFGHRGNSFIATFYTSAALADQDSQWLRRFDGFRLLDRQKNALVHIKNTGEAIANGRYREINHMRSVGDDARARAELNKLVAYRLLSSVGEKKARQYTLGPLAQG